MVFEGNASLSIKGRKMGVTIKVTRDNLLLEIVRGDIYGALEFLLYSLLSRRWVRPMPAHWG